MKTDITIAEEQQVREMLDNVTDPEVPVLSVNDLGIIRNIKISVPAKTVEITITPTYSGCPAMDVISMNIRLVLMANGYEDVRITKVLSPAWTTEWMPESGRQKLKAFGIAPPGHPIGKSSIHLFEDPLPVQCPLCNSFNTTMISEFGSTACKSLYRCNDCKEPFDHFKCH